MVHSIRFPDAARLLAADDSALLTAVDHLATAGLVALAPITGGATAALFDPKNDLIRLIDQLRHRIRGRLDTAQRRERGELLVAAHTIVSLSAFYDTVTALVPEIDKRQLNVDVAADATPVPHPAETPDALADRLHTAYRRMGRRLGEFVAGLAVWDDLTETRRQQITATLAEEVPSAAIRLYEDRVRQLAVECPEFGMWIGTRERAGVQAELRTGLEQLTRLMAMSAGNPEARWGELARGYAAALDQPVIQPGEHGAPPDLVIPTLRASYIDPAFRVIRYDTDDRPSEDSWWERAVPLREDLGAFLVAYLTAPEATRLPLLVLGHPGAGKSVLIRTLAARLAPSTGFRPIRVDLRRVPADGLIVDQIQLALYEALQRDLRWADLATAAAGDTPVVLLDGFDELLQGALGGSANYLERVREFQETARVMLDCPVAVIVTSRTVVAHRARIPPGSTVVRLEPFDASRRAQWIDVWNATNHDYFDRHRLVPLPVDVVERQPELACQPLLLLMLALYDADGNALQDERARITDAELYDRLLSSFTRREVRKGNEHLDDARLDVLVSHELEWLAVTAFAMFNRGSQRVTEADLDADLSGLAVTQPGQPASMPARLLIGRFFFMHVAQADPGDTSKLLRTYEFVHATFGEYLVAWLVVRALPTTPAPRLLTSMPSDIDDTLTASILSFQPLTDSAAVVEFLDHLVRQMAPARRAETHHTLVQIFRRSLDRITWRDNYRPAAKPLPMRLASYSANLVLLILLTSQTRRITLTALFGGTEDQTERWRSLARLWSQMNRHSWNALLDQLVFADAMVPELRLDRAGTLPQDFVAEAYRTADLIRDPHLRTILNGVSPLVRLGAPQFAGGDSSPIRHLLALLLGTHATIAEQERAQAAIAAFAAGQPEEIARPYLAALRRLRADD